MTTWILVLLFSIGAVLALTVAMSIAFVIREHFIKGKIISGWQQKRRHGATCATRNVQKEHSGNDADDLCHDIYGNCIPCVPKGE